MKYLYLLFLPLFTISGCSDKDEIPIPKTSSSETTGTPAPVRKKVSDDNVFKGQLDALDAAKQIGITAQDSIDKNQRALESTR